MAGREVERASSRSMVVWVEGRGLSDRSLGEERGWVGLWKGASHETAWVAFLAPSNGSNHSRCRQPRSSEDQSQAIDVFSVSTLKGRIRRHFSLLLRSQSIWTHATKDLLDLHSC